MVDILPVLVNLLAVALVPLMGWLSQRWTRESRLSARVSRLGSLLALIPESDQREALSSHVLAATEELISWIDPITRGVRRLQSLIGLTLLGLGVAFVLWLEQVAQLEPALSLTVSIFVGALVAIVSAGSGAVLQKFFERRRETRQLEERLSKLRAGESIN